MPVSDSLGNVADTEFDYAFNVFNPPEGWTQHADAKTDLPKELPAPPAVPWNPRTGAAPAVALQKNVGGMFGGLDFKPQGWDEGAYDQPVKTADTFAERFNASDIATIPEHAQNTQGLLKPQNLTRQMSDDGVKATSRTLRAVEGEMEENLAGANPEDENYYANMDKPPNARSKAIAMLPPEQRDKGLIVQGPVGPATGAKAPETISNAAIKLKDGSVHEGPTHFNIINNILDQRPNEKFNKATDGFMTSSGRFLDRQEAMELAKRSGQVKGDASYFSGSEFTGYLASEDLRMTPAQIQMLKNSRE